MYEFEVNIFAGYCEYQRPLWIYIFIINLFLLLHACLFETKMKLMKYLRKIENQSQNYFQKNWVLVINTDNHYDHHNANYFKAQWERSGVDFGVHVFFFKAKQDVMRFDWKTFFKKTSFLFWTGSYQNSSTSNF